MIIHSSSPILLTSAGEISSTPVLLIETLPAAPFENDWFMILRVSLPIAAETYLAVSSSQPPPMYINVSQLPDNSPHESLYIFFSWASDCKMIHTEISYLRMVASFSSNFGILPILANSSAMSDT